MTRDVARPPQAETASAAAAPASAATAPGVVLQASGIADRAHAVRRLTRPGEGRYGNPLSPSRLTGR